jgi:hypothetical protein
MFVAQFVILLLVPAVAAMLLGSDCYGMWVLMWEPCQSDAKFDMGYYTKAHTTADGSEYLGYNTPFTTHTQICGLEPPAPGRCSRFVMESVGRLLIAKLMFQSFVSPVMTIVQEKFMRVVLRREPGYAPRLSFDTEMIMVSMMMDEALVLGIAIPAVAALTCASVGMRLAALHMTTTELGMKMNDKRHIQPLCNNLIVSLLLGAALNSWFYVDNASQVAGSGITFVGIPLAILIGAGSSLFWLKSHKFGNTMEPREVLADLQLQLLPAAAEAGSQTAEPEIVHTAEYAPPTQIDQQRGEDFYTPRNAPLISDIHELL